MKESKNNLLAIAPATKRLGIVVFSQTDLIYFSVKTFAPPRTETLIKRQVSQMIRELINEFEPKTVALKVLGKQQVRSKNLRLVSSLIRQESEKAGIVLKEVSFEQAKKKLCFGKKPNKENAFEVLSLIYPELKRFAGCQNKSQKDYYNSLLSAAAIGCNIHKYSMKNTNQNQNRKGI
jgi:hypothetical protein